MLDEADGKAVIRTLGLPVPAGQRVAGDGVAAAAESLGYPVVLKMMGPRLAHKSEAGAVAVGLGDADAVATALSEMRRNVAAHDPQAVTDSFLIEKMAPKPIAELIVSVRRDPQFGLAMTIGSGGVLVELVGDSQTLLLPTTSADIAAAISRLRVMRLLAGYRGGKAADVEALVAALLRLAEGVMARAAVLAEVEINPLFVCDTGCWVVDVLIHDVAG